MMSLEGAWERLRHCQGQILAVSLTLQQMNAEGKDITTESAQRINALVRERDRTAKVRDEMRAWISFYEGKGVTVG